MSTGKVFKSKDLIPQQPDIEDEQIVAQDEGDPIGRIADIFRNIDSMIGHIKELKEGHPDMFGGQRGGAPTMENTSRVTGNESRTTDPMGVYALFLGMLNRAGEISCVSLKQTMVDNKPQVIEAIRQAMAQ